MSKGLKDALTVLIVTLVTHVERVERSLNSFNCYSCYHVKTKDALTVLIVTLVTHVERVERSLNSYNCYSCYSGWKGSKVTYRSLLITFLIFNGFAIRKKFWKAEDQGFPTIPSTLCVCRSMSKGSKVMSKYLSTLSTCFDIHRS